MRGWNKIKTACKYADVSERTFRKWLKAGLRHVRLDTGTVLTKKNWIDDYLESYEVVENMVDQITKEVCGDL